LDLVAEFQQAFLEVLRAKHQKDVIDVLASGVINGEVTALIEQVASETAKTFKN
jgi:F-type H+-transporting ATPase subunit alpha